LYTGVKLISIPIKIGWSSYVQGHHMGVLLKSIPTKIDWDFFVNQYKTNRF